MRIGVKESPKGYQELHWARKVNTRDQETWSAYSADHVREFSVTCDKTQIDMCYWSFAWRLDKNTPPNFSPIRFLNRGEAQEVAQMIENEHELDFEKLKNIAAGNAVTVGGNNWKYYGIQNNQRLWICVLPGNKTAYVATCSYDDPHQRWHVSKREWVSSTKAPGDDVEELKIKKLGEHKDLYRAQMSVALLTDQSSKSALGGYEAGELNNKT
jgi:hypothetical protein